MPPKGVEIATPSNEDEGDAATLESFIEEEPDEVSVTKQKVQRFKFFRYIRIGILFCIWFTSATILFITHENEYDWKITQVPVGIEGKAYPIEQQPTSHELTIWMSGPFLYKLSDVFGHESVQQHSVLDGGRSGSFLVIEVMRRFENAADETAIEIASNAMKFELVDASLFEASERVVRMHTFELTPSSGGGVYFYHFALEGGQEPVAIVLQSYPTATATKISLALSITIVLSMYMMLFWDLTSRAIIGIMMCTLSVALMSLSELRPTLPKLVEFVDIDYALLLFGLTIIFGVLGETSADGTLAVHVYRLSNGHVWPLLSVLCAIIFVGSAVLDHLTVLVLTTLFTLRLCEVAQLNPAHVLTCLIIFSNIGDMLGPSSNVRNILIVHSGNVNYVNYHESYSKYIAHMIIPVALSALMNYGFLRLFYRGTVSMQNEEAPIITRLKHAIRFWSHTAKSVGEYSEAEKAVQQNVQQKVTRLRDRLKRLGKMPLPSEDFDEKLRRLKEANEIKNKPQMIMCIVILSMVIIMQLLHSFDLVILSNGFICLLFSLVLLALTDWHDFESLMHRVDWSTIIFIACFMIITRALAPLGLTEALSDLVVHRISKMDMNYRLQVGSLVLILISTFAAGLFDTNYVRRVITRSVVDLVDVNPEHPLALDPLLLSALLGTGFGCNLTLISAFSNIVCAGLAEKHDYKFYFWDFFKVGATVTLINIILSMAYVSLFILALGY